MSNPPHSTARMDCTSLNPLPFWILSFLMVSLGGRGGQQCGGGDTVCRRLAPWSIGKEKISGILVGPGKKGQKKSKTPVLDTIESTAVFFHSPLFEHWEKPILRSCRLWSYQKFGVGTAPPGLSPAAILPVE